MKIEKDMSHLMYEALKGCGLQFFMALPCKHLAEIIACLEKDNEIVYVPITREEEGIGIAAGAFLGDKIGVLLMQNSGLGNCINALASLTGFYRIPLILLVSQRGMPGEKISAQVPMGTATEDLLKAVGIPFYRYETREDLLHISDHVSHAQIAETTVALLINPQFWSAR